MEGYKWIRDDSAPMDIWAHRSHFEQAKELIASLNWMEGNMLFGFKYETKAAKEDAEHKYVEEHKHNVSDDQARDFCSGGFGNVLERSLTIINADNTTEKWKRVKQ